MNPARTANRSGGQVREHPLIAELRELVLDQIAAPLSPSEEDEFEQITQAINRKLVKPELWGVSQVATCLGVPAYQNVYKLAGLPDPVYTGTRGRLWDPDDIRRFRRRRERTRGGA